MVESMQLMLLHTVFSPLPLVFPVLVLSVVLLYRARGDVRRFRFRLVAIVSGVIGAIGLAWYGHGLPIVDAASHIGIPTLLLVSYPLMYVIFVPGLFIGYLLVVLWIVANRFRLMPRLMLVMSFVFSVWAWCALAAPLGSALALYDLTMTRRYCEELAPRLDTYRAAHGHYPEKLAELDGSLPDAPMTTVNYWSRNAKYLLSFRDPREFGTSLRLNERREWKGYD